MNYDCTSLCSSWWVQCPLKLEWHCRKVEGTVKKFSDTLCRHRAPPLSLCFRCLWLLLLRAVWRDVLETEIIRRKLTDARANPSTQRKRCLSPIWQITLNFFRQEQLYALLKNKRKETYIISNTQHK